MPFTPLHMGPGLLVKACLQGAFSLMVFGWSQILIDLQPLYVILSGEGRLHGFSHTYLGAALIAPVAAVSGKYLGEIGLRLVDLQSFNPIRWPVSVASAFIGTFSHVLIDSIMHGDMQPLAPFSDHRYLLRLVSVDTLHLLCVASAIVGAVGWLLLRRSRAANELD